MLSIVSKCEKILCSLGLKNHRGLGPDVIPLTAVKFLNPSKKFYYLVSEINEDRKIGKGKGDHFTQGNTTELNGNGCLKVFGP